MQEKQNLAYFFNNFKFDLIYLKSCIIIIVMKEKDFSFKEASLAFLLAFLICQVVVLFGQLFLSIVLTMFKMSSEKIADFTSTPLGYLIISLFQVSSFVLVFLYCYKKTNLKENFSRKKRLSYNTIIFIVLGIVVMFSLSYFINYFTTLLNLFGDTSSSLPYEIDNLPTLFLSLTSLALLPSIGEELLFRATLLNGLKKRNKLFAIVVSSLFFSIFHFNLSQLFYPFLFGLLLGCAYVYTENILVPILMHFTNNALNLILQYFLGETIFEISTTNFVLMLLGIIIFLIIISTLLYKIFKREKTVIINNDSSKPQDTEQNYHTKMTNSDKLRFFTPIVIMIIFYIINI